MRCSNCRATNREGVKFCEDCGASLLRRCPKCGADVLPEKSFCGFCGTALATPIGRAISAPVGYTPKHLAEKILTSRSAVEGERKDVTVLFVDVVESTRLAQGLNPEEMHRVMDGALRLMTKAVHRYEGTVNQFLGDGLMALFGAPLAIEDHALRGVQAALAIQETLRGYSEQLTRERGLQLRLRLGLNTGSVVVGRIGDDLRMDYTAVGDTTHLAARLQAFAEPDTILITEVTHRLVEDQVRTEPLGPVMLKGRDEAVCLYKVIGRRRQKTRFELAAERGLTRLVGRRRELDVLRDRFERAKAGHGQIVAIVGEAGAGKSRLLFEFRNACEKDWVTWLEGHCVSYVSEPFRPILDIIRANFQIDEGDNPLQIEEKLRHGVRQIGPQLEPILVFLADLLGVRTDDKSFALLDPQIRRQRTYEAVRTLTIAGSQRRPIVLIIENLHCIDKSSEDYVLRFLSESLAGVSVLLLTTHRPGYAVPWADKTYYTQLALDYLTREEAREMVCVLLGTQDVPEELFSLIWDKTEGNPLFIEEVVKALVEHGLQTHGGRVEWSGAGLIAPPGAMQDILRARIDRLEDPVKRALQAAAVIGRHFSLKLLAEISDRTEDTASYLATLRHLELVHEKSFFPELEYTFKHAVTQEVAYEGVLAQRRYELHGAIGRAIETIYAESVEEKAATLAYHFSRSKHPERSVNYAILAGDRAARLFANAEATGYYELALTTMRALPPSADVQRSEIDATLKLCSVAVTRQDSERDQANLERAYVLAQGLSDESRVARIRYWQGRIHYLRWDPMAAVDYARESLEIADRLNDEALAGPPVNLIGRVQLLTSEFVKAKPMLERSVAQMRIVGNRGEEATAAGLAGTALAFMGQFDAAVRYVNRGIQIAQDIRNPFAEAAAFYYRGIVHDQHGEWSNAIADYERSVEVAEAAGDKFRVYIVKCWAGRAWVMAQKPERGHALIRESIVLAERIGTKLALSWQRTWLAASLLALGQVNAVPSLCEEAVILAQAASDRFNCAIAYRTLAEALSSLGPGNYEKSEASVRQALEIQQQIEARPELARTYAVYARLLAAQEKRDEAMNILHQALTMFEAMGMAWDLNTARLTPRMA